MPGALADLVDKYRLLEALGAAEPGRTSARRDAMRAIAVRFPGALREWDETPRDELARRRKAAEAALASFSKSGHRDPDAFFAAQQTWMRLDVAVHRRLRTVLAVKRFIAGRPVDDALAASVKSVFGISRAGLDAIAAPPGGRVSELVRAEVAASEGLSVAELRAALHFKGGPQKTGDGNGGSDGSDGDHSDDGARPGGS